MLLRFEVFHVRNDSKVLQSCQKKNAVREITGQANVQETNSEESMSRSQRKCLLCGKPEHYQKKCPGKRSVIEENQVYSYDGMYGFN